MDATDLASAVKMTGDLVSNFPAESTVMFTAGMNPPVPLCNFETISAFPQENGNPCGQMYINGYSSNHDSERR